MAATLQWNRGLELNRIKALKRLSPFYHFGAYRVSQLVAVTGAFQFSASEVPLIFARPADACPVAFSAHCQPLVRHSRGARNANSMNANARTERTASRRNAFNIVPSLNQR